LSKGTLKELNAKLKTKSEVIGKRINKVGVLLLGNTAPGGNNIFDGLLRYKTQHKGTSFYGYVNGIDGVNDDNLRKINEASYAPYRNLGGYDYLGRSANSIKGKDFQKLA
jgi:6-phosphofructokinase